MTVARLIHTRHNENAPTVGSGWGAETEPSGGLALQLSNLTDSFCIAVAPRQRSCAMSMHPYSRNKPQGRAHRDKIARWILPRLTPGCRVPSANWMARFLGISSSEGGRQIRRALTEAGIATETRGVGRGRRIYVVSMGERP
jgi:hypothetical protein